MTFFVIAVALRVQLTVSANRQFPGITGVELTCTQKRADDGRWWTAAVVVCFCSSWTRSTETRPPPTRIRHSRPPSDVTMTSSWRLIRSFFADTGSICCCNTCGRKASLKSYGHLSRHFPLYSIFLFSSLFFFCLLLFHVFCPSSFVHFFITHFITLSLLFYLFSVPFSKAAP